MSSFREDELILAALNAGYISKGRDRLAAIYSVTRVLGIRKVSYTEFGSRLIQDLKAVALRDGIQLDFFYSTESICGSISICRRYKPSGIIPPLVNDFGDKSRLCYEWRIL